MHFRHILLSSIFMLSHLHLIPNPTFSNDCISYVYLTLPRTCPTYAPSFDQRMMLKMGQITLRLVVRVLKSTGESLSKLEHLLLQFENEQREVQGTNLLVTVFFAYCYTSKTTTKYQTRLHDSCDTLYDELRLIRTEYQGLPHDVLGQQ